MDTVFDDYTVYFMNISRPYTNDEGHDKVYASNVVFQAGGTTYNVYSKHDYDYHNV